MLCRSVQPHQCILDTSPSGQFLQELFWVYIGTVQPSATCSEAHENGFIWQVGNPPGLSLLISSVPIPMIVSTFTITFVIMSVIATVGRPLGINLEPFEEEFRAFEEVRTTTRHVGIMIGPKENKISTKRRRETPMPAKITREHLSHAGFEVDFSSSTSVLSLVLSVIIRKRIYPLTVMFTG